MAPVNPPAAPPPTSRVGTLLRSAAASLASLQLTLVLLAFGLGLVLAGTLDQVNLGIWTVQEKYFRAFVVHTPAGPFTLPLFPGGYTVGGLLLLNLTAAFAVRFAFTWRKGGLLLAHFGLILLLVGELLTGLLQRDFHVRITEGETRAFAESPREHELALIDATDRAFDEVVAIPGDRLAAKRDLQHPRLPFRVLPRIHYPNSSLHPGERGAATQGVGLSVAAAPRPFTARPNEANAPAAYVELIAPDRTLGIWLVSPLLAEPQEFTHDGRTWRIALRPRRLPLPHSLQLLRFSHDRYPGTEIPRNFSSRLLLRGKSGGEREVLISMNEPLREGGLAHYQAGFADNDRTSILQVVRNPAWTLPYVACALMGAGLLWQFGLGLAGFARSRRAAPAENPAFPRAPSRLASAGLVAAAAAVALTLRAPAPSGPWDLAGFGRLPTLVNGRVKPLDTVARHSLLLLQGRQRAVDAEGRELEPVAWLLDVLFVPARAERAPVFEVVHPDLLALLGLEPAAGSGGKRFSLEQLRPRLAEADRQARLADDVEPALRTSFQTAAIQLRNAVALHQRLQASLDAPGDAGFLDAVARIAVPLDASAPLTPREAETLARTLGVMGELGHLHLVPPSEGTPPEAWRKASAAWREGLASGRADPAAHAYALLGRAWRDGDHAGFNAAVLTLHSAFTAAQPVQMRKVMVETRFNAAQPFHTSMVLFVGAFLAGILSWLRWPAALGRIAFGLVAIAFLLTTAGMVTRMWLESRPPVTNLYSSALFVGWGAVALCLVLEALHRRGLGSVAAGVIGFATLLIAHHLSLGGDTLEMMRAVLDSNFWLATHVVTITAGYSAVFLAGFLGLLHIVRGVFTRSLDAATAAALTRMTYGVTCFALLFNVTGTVLGGIWADQSWGRFWGWDPKENGALLIVLWNAITLHARAGGLVRGRGLAVLAVLGNIVTAWSWFGVNMLGIGLHSYGFMGAAFWWLLAFAGSQVLIASCAAVPEALWRSAGVPRPAPAGTTSATTGTAAA